jgi:hypothetical protein
MAKRGVRAKKLFEFHDHSPLPVENECPSFLPKNRKTRREGRATRAVHGFTHTMFFIIIALVSFIYSDYFKQRLS